jgi:hypothetical protein
MLLVLSTLWPCLILLRFPLFMLPQVINNFVEAGISFGRVRSSLLSEEHVPVSTIVGI